MAPSSDAATVSSTSPPVDAPVVRSAVVASALRCIMVYVLAPSIAPVVGITQAAASPVVVALLVIGTALATRAFARAWRRGSAATIMISSVLVSLNLLAVVNRFA